MLPKDEDIKVNQDGATNSFEPSFKLSTEEIEYNLAIEKPHGVSIGLTGIVDLKFTNQRMRETEGVKLPDQEIKQDT